MPIYKIADLNISINPIYSRTEKRLLPYITDSDSYDFKISVTADEIERCVAESAEPCNACAAEGTIILTMLCREIFDNYNGFFFHSSCFLFNGGGYVFTAVSGTGKSTHTALWRKLFKDKVTMINDDKPIIRRQNGSFNIFGTPWMGKAEIGNNIKAPVKAVFVLQRGKENCAVRVKPGEVFKQILEATLVPRESENMVKLLKLFDEFFTAVPLYRLTCNTDVEAAQTA